MVTCPSALSSPLAEPSPARAEGSAMHVPAFELLESKLRPPHGRAGAVPAQAADRSSWRQESGAVPVVFLSAGPGWGKTTLLTQWAARSQRPFAWVSVDANDNDPIVLLTYVATALDRVSPTRPERVRRHWRRRAPRSREPLSRASGRPWRRWTSQSSSSSTTCIWSRARPAWMPSPRSRGMFPRARSWRSRREGIPRCRWERCGRGALRWRSGRTSCAWTRPRRASC